MDREYPRLRPYLKRIRRYLAHSFFSFDKYDIPACFDIHDRDDLDFILSTTPPANGFVYNNRDSGAYFGNMERETGPPYVPVEEKPDESDIVHFHINFYTQMRESTTIRYKKFGIEQSDKVLCNINSELIYKFRLKQRRIESKFFEERLFGRLQMELVDQIVDDIQVLMLLDQTYEYHSTDDYRKLVKIAKE